MNIMERCPSCGRTSWAAERPDGSISCIYTNCFYVDRSCVKDLGMTKAAGSNLMGLPHSFILGVGPETKQYTKADLLNLIDELLPQIRDKFAYKNKAYGRDEDAFHNFRNTAKRVLNDDSFEGMYKTLLVYKDKHDVALANRGMDDPEFEERFIDNIVYSLIAIGMKRARG
jgi:hypothetical protein